MVNSEPLSLAKKFQAYLSSNVRMPDYEAQEVADTLAAIARDHHSAQMSFSAQVRRQIARDEPDFYGAGITTQEDVKRVKGGLKKIYLFVRDGKWHTLRRISAETGVPEASVSAGLRSLRREKYGAHTIQREHIGSGLHVYRFVPNPATVADLEEQLKVPRSVNGVRVPIERVGGEPEDRQVPVPVRCECGAPADTDFNGMQMCYPCLDKTI